MWQKMSESAGSIAARWRKETPSRRITPVAVVVHPAGQHAELAYRRGKEREGFRRMKPPRSCEETAQDEEQEEGQDARHNTETRAPGAEPEREGSVESG